MRPVEVGDRVVCLRDFPDGNPDIRVGSTGTVCRIHRGDKRCGVYWDMQISGGHNCFGSCSNGYGWYINIEDIKVVDECPEEICDDSFLSVIGGEA